MIVDRRVAALLFSSTRLTVATPPSFSVPTTELRRRICEPRCAACILVAANERSFSSFSLSTFTTFDHSLAASDAISPEVEHFLEEFWEMLAYVGNTLIFLIAGLAGLLASRKLGTA